MPPGVQSVIVRLGATGEQDSEADEMRGSQVAKQGIYFEPSSVHR